MAYIGIPPFGQTIRSVTNITATSGQTTFNITGGYVVGYVDVFLNGILLTPSDYTATDGLSVVLASGATTGDEFQALAYQPVSLVDTYRKSEVDSLINNIDALPTQTGQSGKYLTTDGTDASWGTVDLTSKVSKTGDTMTGALVTPMVVTDSSMNFRNYIINGGFDVWQRGTSVAPVNSWGPDRFFNTNTAMTWTRATNTLGGPCPYMCTLTGGGSDSRFRFTFELPSSTSQPPFNVGSYWTLSMYCSLNLAGLTMSIGYANNPNDSTDNASTTGTWVSLGGNRYGLTVQINAVNTNNKLAMRFSGPFSGPVAEGVGSISVTGVQFEAGSVATPFERRPYGTELSLCQRYYQVIKATAGGASKTASGPAVGYLTQSLPVEMRTAPSIGMDTSGGNATALYYFTQGSSDHTVSSGSNLSVSTNYSTTSTVMFLISSSVIGWSVNLPLMMRSGNIYASSEL